MTNVTIRSSVADTGMIRLFHDGNEIPSNQETTIQVVPGEEQTLSWIVIGSPGTKYSVAITKPETAKFSHENSLDVEGKDVGFVWFKA